jgi:DNA-binding transcriptional ArsR family regulator
MDGHNPNKPSVSIFFPDVEKAWKTIYNVQRMKRLNGVWRMPQDLSELQKLFSDCSKVIAAVGDETRQSIMMALMEQPGEGMRVGVITEKTNLSRPAVSHHIGILRDAGIIRQNKRGTMNFYCLNPDQTAVLNLRKLCQGILDAMDQCGRKRS